MNIEKVDHSKTPFSSKPRVPLNTKPSNINESQNQRHQNPKHDLKLDTLTAIRPSPTPQISQTLGKTNYM